MASEFENVGEPIPVTVCGSQLVSELSGKLAYLEDAADLAEKELAKVRWTKITDDFLPSADDELFRDRRLYRVSEVKPASIRCRPTANHWLRLGYTHFRPINAPAPPHTGARLKGE